MELCFDSIVKRGALSPLFFKGLDMEAAGGGLIVILNYSSGGNTAFQNALLTQAADHILAESSQYIEAEVP